MQVLTFLTILFFGTACNVPAKKKLPKEKEHPKLIKTISEPQFGDVRCSLQDNEGNLWFGTTENGLYIYDGKSFRKFLLSNGQNIKDVSCLLKDRNGKIWIGTGDGLILYDGKTIAKFKIPLPKDLPPNTNPNYQRQWIFSMLQGKDGKIWFATIDGLYIYDGKTFTLFLINEAPNGFLSRNAKVERMLVDSEGNIWFGARTNEGVFRYDGKSIINFKLKPTTAETAIRNWGWPQMQDKNGNIWFSNWDGAYRYDGKKFTSFTKNDGLSRTGLVATIIEDKKGIIWLVGDGLSRYDGKSIAPFTTKDELVNLGGWSILEDAIGNLWVGTKEKGLYIFDGKEFITYSEYKQ